MKYLPQTPKAFLLYAEFAQVITYVVSLIIYKNFGPPDELLGGIQVAIPFLLFFILPVLYLLIWVVVVRILKNNAAFKQIVLWLLCCVVIIDIFVVISIVQESF